MPDETGLITGVDKKVCLEILDRGLRPVYTGRKIFTDPELRKREFFRGLAKDCNYFFDPEFQEIMRRHGIGPENLIAVAAMDNPLDFAIIKV